MTPYQQLITNLAKIFACIVCVIASYGAMREGADGWGWFLVVAICIACVQIKVGQGE